MFVSCNSPSAHGGQQILPYAFTEQSIAMLSAILRRNISVELVKTTSRKFG